MLIFWVVSKLIHIIFVVFKDIYQLGWEAWNPKKMIFWKIYKLALTPSLHLVNYCADFFSETPKNTPKHHLFGWFRASLLASSEFSSWTLESDYCLWMFAWNVNLGKSRLFETKFQYIANANWHIAVFKCFLYSLSAFTVLLNWVDRKFRLTPNPVSFDSHSVVTAFHAERIKKKKPLVLSSS